MKILYIALKYDYGDPQRGLSFEHYNFYDSLLKMNNREHKIVYFPFDEKMARNGQEKMNKELLDVVWLEKPDFCFFFLFGNEIFKEVIEKITKESGSATFNWFADDHWRFDNYSRYLAPLFHWVSTTDSRALKSYYKIGYRNVIKTQWACNHFLYRPKGQIPPDRYNYEVTFVGQPHGNRKKTIEKIKKEGISVETWGHGWENGKIDQEKMLDIFYTSKINLNPTKSSGGLDIKNIAKIFLGRHSNNRYYIQYPKLWISNIISLANKSREQIKGRIFEVLGCGGFLLTSTADNLEDYFEDGKEICIFKNEKELIEKINYYMTHDDEREKIAQNGYERVIREHTYEKRFNELFNLIFRL